MKKKNIGSSFDSWLCEEGIYNEVTIAAMKAARLRLLTKVADLEDLLRSLNEPESTATQRK